MEKIILFDGECHFCDRSVQFIIKRDTKGFFQFASLQSDVGKALLKQYGAPMNIDSFVLIENNRCYFQSSAGLRVCKSLKGMWKLCYFLLVVPKPLRDGVYRVIARNRYKWFGVKESCMLPSPEERKRFLS